MVNKTFDRFQLSSLYPADDHIAPAILPPEPGRQKDEPFFVFYTGHGASDIMRYRTSLSPESVDFGEERTVAFSSPFSKRCKISYAQAYRWGDRILLLTRIDAERGAWTCRISEDGGETWENQRTLYDGGEKSYAYMTTQRGRPEEDVINVATGYIPSGGYVNQLNATQKIHAGRLRLSDGSVENMDGERVANLLTGEGLPLAPDDFTLVYEPRENEYTRLFAVSSGDADHMEVLFMGFRDWEGKSDGVYRYAVWEGSRFRVSDMAGTGTIIDATSYFAGGDIGNPGTVCLARERLGEWMVELWKTKDCGASWSVFELDQSADPVKLFRPMDICNYTAGPAPDACFAWVKGLYRDMHVYDTSIKVLLP